MCSSHSVRAVTAPDRLTRPPTPAGFDPSRAAERAADPQGWRFPRGRARRRLPGDRRASRHPPLPARPGARGRAAAGARGRAPGAVGGPDAALAADRDPRARAPASRCTSWPSASASARPIASTSARGSSSTRRSRGSWRRRSACACAATTATRAPRCWAAARSPRPTSTAPPARSRTCGSRRAPRAWAWAGSASTGPTTCARCSASRPRVDPIAYLCLGWPDERPVRPGPRGRGLVRAARARRGGHAGALGGRRAGAGEPHPPARPDRAAATAARDRLDRLVKPAGSLGRARGADRALGGDHGRPAAGAPARGRARLRRRPRPRRSTARACSSRRCRPR